MTTQLGKLRKAAEYYPLNWEMYVEGAISTRKYVDQSKFLACLSPTEAPSAYYNDFDETVDEAIDHYEEVVRAANLAIEALHVMKSYGKEGRDAARQAYYNERSRSQAEADKTN